MNDNRLFSHLFINNGFYFCLIKTQIDRQTESLIIKGFARWRLFIDNLNGLYVCIAQMHFFGKNCPPAYLNVSLIYQYFKLIGRYDVDVRDPNTIAQVTATIFKINTCFRTDFL